ncbi:MAG: RNA-binding protein [Chlamydiae bacterium RIFCSPHIGHO2_12_FULL_27_8]|nr:MAG: RNA-binding protein [Chlamydiae bacterium RIFCSPHIGHO2_12_FULL_27_8]
MKLYVGNLPHALTEQQLMEVFSPFGEVVSAKIITDRDTHKSRGFGFVEMSSKEEGEKAIEELNGKEIGGRTAVVNEARQREEKRPFGNGNNANKRQQRRF